MNLAGLTNVLLALACAALLPRCAHSQTLLQSPWPIAGQNLHQTRVSPYEGPQTVDYYWSFLAKGQQSSEPVVSSDGTLYFGDQLGFVYSLSASGSLNWNVSLSNQTTSTKTHQVMNSPALGSDGSVFVACEDGYLYRLSPAGTLIWKKYMTGGMITSPVISDKADVIYVNTISTLRAIYTGSGEVYWSLGYTSAYAPAIDSSGMLYLTIGTYLYFVSAEGTLLSTLQVTTSSNLVTSPLLGPDGAVYVAEYQWVTGVRNGAVRWSTQVAGGSIMANLVLGPDGNVYAATVGEAIYCLSPDGDVQWIFQTGNANDKFMAPMMDAWGNLYVGSQSGLVYGIRTAGGSPDMFWQFATGSLSVNSPVLLQSGVLVVSGVNHVVYAFRPQNCSAGQYVSPEGASFCSECAVGYYSAESNALSCARCAYPTTSIREGQTTCSGILLLPEGGLTTLSLVLSAMAAVVLVCMYHGRQRVAIFVNLLFPTLDVFSDLAYLTTNEFYNVALFAACFVSIAIPTATFVKALVERRALPRLVVPLRRSWWLRAGNEADHIYFPLFPCFADNGGRLPLLSSTEHSTFASVLLEGVAWLVAIAAQAATFAVVLPANVLALAAWFVVGAFLHLSKMITIGSVWNVWFAFWTQSDAHATEVDVDTAELIQSLEEEFLTETIPQFVIQLTNNLLLGRFTPIAAFSMTFSVVMSVNSVWRHVYQRFVRTETVALEEIPLGMVWRVRLDAWAIDWLIVDATLRSARKLSPKEQRQRLAQKAEATTTPLLAEAFVADGDGDEEAALRKATGAATGAAAEASAPLASVVLDPDA